MRRAALLALALAAAPAWGGDFELEAGLGGSFPRFQQSLTFDPATSAPPSPA